MAKILVDRREKTALMKLFNVSAPTIRCALNGETLTPLALRIRAAAIKRGGVEIGSQKTMKLSDFEQKIIKAGYYLDQVKYIHMSYDIDVAFGSITIGETTKQVKWDRFGNCYTLSNDRLETFDLK